MARWHTCNILQTGPDTRELWQFSVGGKYNLLHQETKRGKEPLPEKVVGKDWQTLFQPKLNIALLPSDKVFLRVVQLPKADYAETQSMVEMQLEKVSPLPTTQIAWGFELLTSNLPDMQTAVVIIVARAYVEEYLSLLEGQGFVADRLELPFLDLLRATEIKEDGAWIYTEGTGGTRSSCLVAWWYSGTLQNLSLVHLPADHTAGAALQAQLAQIAWAGEFEGWLVTSPRYHLVATEQTAALWKTYFTSEQPLEVLEPLPSAKLAELTARRASADNLRTNLLPPEYSTRYHQLFIDRLWMRALGALVLVYLVVAGLYLGWVQFAKWRNTSVEDQIVSLGGSYTNALQLKERVRVMQEQRELQFMALDCWKAVADNLPAELTLKSMNFERGRHLTLMGVVAEADQSKVFDFNAEMRKHTLFKDVAAPNMPPMPGGMKGWSFGCDLKRTGVDSE